ncbi:MAG TPA: hypothetical protein VGF45_06830 [Polyangia bacterium]
MLGFAVLSCGGDGKPAPEGTGGSSGGFAGSGGNTSGASGGNGGSTTIPGASSGNGGSVTAGTGGTGGSIGDAAGGGSSDLVSTDGAGVDTAPSAPDVATEVRPETRVDLTGDSASSDLRPPACNVGPGDGLPGVSAADFCTGFEMVCQFQPGGLFYRSRADCLSKYGGISASMQACRAERLCLAARGIQTNSFCLQAAGYNWPGC